jgi:hypothetical protein
MRPGSPTPSDPHGTWRYTTYSPHGSANIGSPLLIATADSLCGSTDTLTHRIIECGNGGEMWRWTKTRMAVILRINVCYIPDDWPLRIYFHICPRQRQEAILWMVAFFFFFRVQHSDQPTLSDYADFMRRARWKAHSLPQRLRRIGNYLTAWQG